MKSFVAWLALTLTAIFSYLPPLFADVEPGSSGVASNYHVISAASDNHAVIKAGGGVVTDVEATITGTAAAYVRLYDATTGFNGCNSASGIIWGMIIPAVASGSGAGDGFALPFPVSRGFVNGLAICITGAFTDTDTTAAPTTAIVNVGFK